MTQLNSLKSACQLFCLTKVVAKNQFLRILGVIQFKPVSKKIDREGDI